MHKEIKASSRMQAGIETISAQSIALEGGSLISQSIIRVNYLRKEVSDACKAPYREVVAAYVGRVPVKLRASIQAL